MKPDSRFRTWMFAILLGGFAAPAALAADSPCDAAAVSASRSTGAPPELLLALTRTETGRRHEGEVRPWPWAVNLAGAGHWFSDRIEAVSFAEAAVQEGHTGLDVGCFQLNYRWHGAAFASIDSMMDPVSNALYAAEFLTSLYRETGDWRLAVGAFHSRRPVDAAGYLERFDEFLAGLSAPDPLLIPVADRTTVRHNTFPLLAGNRSGERGSLVPQTAILAALIPEEGGRRSLISP